MIDLRASTEIEDRAAEEWLRRGRVRLHTTSDKPAAIARYEEARQDLASLVERMREQGTRPATIVAEARAMLLELGFGGLVRDVEKTAHSDGDDRRGRSA